MTKETKTKTVAKINNVNIVLIDGVEKHVPIKPICEALGINPSRQAIKIKEDEILNSVGDLRYATGSDGKQYEMFCLPYMYVFGWLFTINPKNVKDEARENVTRFKEECYKALFFYFSDRTKFLEQKQNAIEKQLEIVDRISNDYTKTKKQLNEARKTLNDVKELTFEEWELNNRQLELTFPIK